MPGPVFLEMPLDLLMNVGDDAELPATQPFEEPPRTSGDPRSVGRAASLLREAKRPVFLVGSQIRWSPYRDRLAEILEQFGAPVFLNGMARGGFPHNHPLLFSRSRRFALSQADVVFVLGTPFDFRVDYGRTPTWAADAKIVQIDLDGAELGRNRKVDIGIQADSGLFLEHLLLESDTDSFDFNPWIEAVRGDENKRRAKMNDEIESNASPPNPLRVCHELGKRLGKNDVVIGDGGDFVATAAYVLKMQWPQLWMDPGPLGTLGVGPGYAMAAKLARPDSKVVLVYGDGSFGLHGLEFEALARQDIPVIALIGNDAGWTQIRRGQVELYGEQRAVATALDYTRYEKVVEACGGVGFWVENIDQLGPALDEAFASKKPSCINVKIAKSDFRKGAISV